MTPDTLNKLEEVFALGGTDKEACFYAGISHQTLYDYQKDHPEFVERKGALKETPILKARRTVVSAVEKNPSDAQWYLERKAKAEFAARKELTGANGDPLLDDKDARAKGDAAIAALTGAGDTEKGE
jgi:hypothetical protein